MALSLADMGLLDASSISIAPAATCWPASTRMAATVPAALAVTRISIFMASITARVCPAVTVSPVATSRRATVPATVARAMARIVGFRRCREGRCFAEE
jgi:hypothetical protein